MRISTVREFRDQASGLLRSKDPILVTRRVRVAGVFFPIKKKGLSEEAILADFDRWRESGSKWLKLRAPEQAARSAGHGKTRCPLFG
jgi:hypothetical protein